MPTKEEKERREKAAKQSSKAYARLLIEEAKRTIKMSRKQQGLDGST